MSALDKKIVQFRTRRLVVTISSKAEMRVLTKQAKNYKSHIVVLDTSAARGREGLFWMHLSCPWGKEALVKNLAFRRGLSGDWVVREGATVQR